MGINIILCPRKYLSILRRRKILLLTSLKLSTRGFQVFIPTLILWRDLPTSFEELGSHIYRYLYLFLHNLLLLPIDKLHTTVAGLTRPELQVNSA